MGIQDGPRSEQKPPPHWQSHTCNPNYLEVSGTPLCQTCFMDYKKREFHEICNYVNSREIYFQCY